MDYHYALDGTPIPKIKRAAKARKRSENIKLKDALDIEARAHSQESWEALLENSATLIPELSQEIGQRCRGRDWTIFHWADGESALEDHWEGAEPFIRTLYLTRSVYGNFYANDHLPDLTHFINVHFEPQKHLEMQRLDLVRPIPYCTLCTLSARLSYGSNYGNFRAINDLRKEASVAGGEMSWSKAFKLVEGVSPSYYTDRLVRLWVGTGLFEAVNPPIEFIDGDADEIIDMRKKDEGFVSLDF